MSDKETRKKSQRARRRQLGSIGSDISLDSYRSDHLAEFNDLRKRATRFDRMQTSDAVIMGLIRAVRNPILRATWSIVDPSEENDANFENMKAYLDQVIFHDLDFKGGKLFEILTMIQFGFSVFEKLFFTNTTEDLGRYVSVSLPIRLQKTIFGFAFRDENDKDFITHFHQIVTNGENDIDKYIPVDQLLVFTQDKVGNDPTGMSILRSMWKSFDIKELTEIMQAIGVEKAALGTPVLKSDPTVANAACSEDILEALISRVESYLGNTTSLIALEPGYDLEIIKADFDEDAFLGVIQQKNTEMALSILAQFLLLGQQGNGGAYALGQDQTDFFLASIEYIASMVESGMNSLIVELIDFQFGKQKTYPQLMASGINSRASSEFAKTLEILIGTGSVKVTPELSKVVANIYKLPEPEQNEGTQDDQPVETPEDEPLQEQDEGDQDETDNPEQEQFSEQLSQKKNDLERFSEESERIRKFEEIESRFVKLVTENERFINKFYQQNQLKEAIKTERRIRKILIDGYKRADTTKEGGAEFFASTPRNTKIESKLNRQVDAEFERFDEKMKSKRFVNGIMGGSLKIATKATRDKGLIENVKEMFSVRIGEGVTVTDSAMKQSEFNSFIKGHILNIDGVFSKEERTNIEKIVANFGNGLSKSVAISQAAIYKMNRNILLLSVVSHPRAVFRGEILRGSQEENVNNFKMVIPNGVDLDPSGKTIQNVFKTKTLFQWEAMNRRSNNAGGVVGGLGLHHNSLDYYFPILALLSVVNSEISKRQRSKTSLESISK